LEAAGIEAVDGVNRKHVVPAFVPVFSASVLLAHVLTPARVRRPAHERSAVEVPALLLIALVGLIFMLALHVYRQVKAEAGPAADERNCRLEQAAEQPGRARQNPCVRTNESAAHEGEAEQPMAEPEQTQVSSEECARQQRAPATARGVISAAA
jgi:hypothetical protein